MDRNRNFKNMDRRLNNGDGQNLQHFMSNSPWSKTTVFDQIQSELTARPVLAQGSVLILDESADAKAGTNTVGATRQYNGRLGKVDLCRVDTCLAYANLKAGLWTLVASELYLPDEWFGKTFAEKRRALAVPTDRVFQTKSELGLQMITRAQANGLPFERLACDAFYGKDRQFRAELQAKNVRYAADIHADTPVYLQEPRVGLPRRRHALGRPPTQWKVLSLHTSHEVRTLARSRRTKWQRVRVRPTERGWLEAEFAVQRVWTITDDGQVRAEWLVIRREGESECTYTVLNDPLDTSPTVLIEASCCRYFTERLFEDGKTEIGWDEFQAQKYQASEHHLALTALALWFVAETKLDWAQTLARDPQLAPQFELEVLPALSTANVRELLKTVLPVPQLTPQEAIRVVMQMFIDRARSTRSRLKTQAQHEAPT